MSKLRKESIIAALGIAALLVFALGNQPIRSKTSDKAGKPEFRLAYFPNLTHAVGIVGVSRGTIQAELPGYNFSTKVVNAGPEAMEALLAGAIDAAYVGPSPAINTYLKSEGKALRIISSASRAGAALVARDGVTIRNLKDLDGKRVAIPQIGGTQDVSLRHFIKTVGLSPKEKRGTVDIIAVKNPDILGLFRQGQLDAAWVPEPWASRLIAEANAKLVIDERDLWPEGRFTTTVLVTKTTFLEDHPEAIEGLLRAHEATAKWINDNPAEAKVAVNAELKRLSSKALPKDVLEAAWARVTFSTDLDAKSVQAFADMAHEAGYLKESPGDLGELFAPALDRERRRSERK